MKGKSIVSLLVSLAVLNTGLVTRQLCATATPAPIFRPVISNIQNQLPRNLVLRLPSSLPATITRYENPKLEFRVDKEEVYLVIKWIGCEHNYPPGGRGYMINCLPLIARSIIVSSKSLPDFNSFRQIAKAFGLLRNVQGYYFEEDMGAPGMGWREVQWIQNGTLFQIKSANLSANELIQVARSMATEPPIYDKTTANSRRTTTRSPSSSRRTTNTQSRNAEASLVTAIRNAVGLEKREFFAQIEYFFTKVDLNNDGNKEVIVYTVGTLCGAWECPVYIFTRSGTGYRLIGTIVSQSNEAKIAVLSTRSKGWLDIATLVYDPHQQKRSNWKLNKFNGTTYENTFQNLSSMPGQVVLRPKGSGISLAQPGI
ncbi:hypothetical protein NIES2119_25940 [[Phormidium ambiguum] IAM M-71]|uniref:Uncharacterized protein n=1 Tax=[Phormidium ambiguum] IAM M-71 TaxID=454136 RepID=A0A1U7I860_9CYAN|nr:hypothetical protein [Phormidium ambiguum]OKH32579.1 hypothetical protein NIES2119_25940 [Phormidium ambiguum IAM M-71]